MSALAEAPCPACGEPTPAAGRFCVHCAAPLPQACPACGQPVVAGARFCMHCAAPLSAGAPAAAGAGIPGVTTTPPISERRLVSVLFADLVGFTTLSEHRDPEEVRELLSHYFDRCRSLIERHGGTVEKFIGDAVMAVWGTPVAREDDAERAVRAALALTQAVSALGADVAMPELRVRAGVLTGSAAVDVGAESEGMVLGDTVNTASRLQSLAAPGSVLVDDVTRRASEAAIEYEDAGRHQVKGRAQPVHAFTALRVVAGVRGARRSAGLEAPLVARESELQTVIGVAEDTVLNRTARLVTITGDAGTGKSRLLWEFFKYIDGIEEGRYWHQGRCLAYGDGVSYWALAEMVRARAGITEDDGPDAERQKLRAAIERFVEDERERRLIEPRVAQLLGLEERNAGEAADLFSGWRLFFERMAGASPVILAFEDLQWADSGLLDFIDYLLEWSADYPIFILALGRSELETRRPSWGTAIRLGPLPADAMVALLGSLVPGLPTDVAERILARAEGVPLYAVETVRMLLDRELVAQEGSRYVVTGTIGDLEVPETLQALMAARMDNLEPAERAVLQEAAVLGISFTPAALVAVSRLSESDVRRALDGLVAKQVLERQTDPRFGEHGQFHFLQGLLRTIALGTLARRERKALHLAAAEHLRSVWEDAPEIAEVLASHYLDAVQADPDAPDAGDIRGRARTTLASAGRRAMSLALGREARRYFEQAAALAETEAEQAEMLSEAGRAAARAADLAAAKTLLTDAIERWQAIGRTADAARTQARLADVHIDENRFEEAAAMIDEARAALEDEVILAELATRRARMAFLSGDYDRGWQEAELALSIADPREMVPLVADAVMTKAVCLFRSTRNIEARALMELSLRLAVDADLGEPALRAYYNLGGYETEMGRLGEAEVLLERGLALARERGYRIWERDILAQQTELLAYAGRWDQCLSVAAELDAVDDDSARVAAQTTPVILAARGQLGELQSLVAHPPRETEWREMALIQDSNRAVVLAALGRVEEAAPLIEALPEFVTGKVGPVVLQFSDVTDLLLATGRMELVRVISERTGVSSPALRGVRLRAAGLLHRHEGRTADAESQLSSAVESLRRAGTPYPLARTLFDLGSLLAEQQHHDEAAPRLAEARRLFGQLQAQPWVERVDAVLAPVEARS